MRNAMWVGGGITGMGEIPMLGNPVKGLTALIKKIFYSGAQGFAYDPNDLTEEKIKWRRNLFTETGFRNGVADVPVRGGTVSNTSLTGFESAILIEHGGALNTYAYKSNGVTGINTFSFFVQMTDLSKPVLAATNVDTAGDFMFVFNGNGVAPANVNIEALPNNIYRLSASLGSGGNGAYGIIKYVSNTQKSFKISGFQIEAGSTVSPYQAITNFHTEFLRQFPLHALYQDAAGTIPVTAAGQPVGLMLDKSKGLVLGTELASVTEVTSLPIDDAGGVKTYLIGSVDVGKTYQISFTVSNFTGSGDVGIAGPTTQWLDGTSVSISSNGTKMCIRTKLASREVSLYTRNTAACVFSNISIKEIKGNHAYQTVSASRPILRKNAVTGANYLEFDGTDDYLQTNNINFTGTDKVSLFAGVRKNGGLVRILCELSSDMNANNGTFYLTAPESGQGHYGFKSRGAVASNAAMTALTQKTSLEDSCVLTASGDISADKNSIRRNGLLSAISYDLGVGNYGNYPLYIGRRGGTSLPFIGHIYGLIGIGKLVSDNETVAIEKELAKRVGVTLNV